MLDLVTVLSSDSELIWSCFGRSDAVLTRFDAVLSEIRRFDMIPYYRSLTKMRIMRHTTVLAC